MRPILIILAIAFGLVAASVSAAGFATVAGEARLPVADRWVVVGDTTNYPLELLHESGQAELLLFRSEIAENEAVDNQQQLRTAVDKVVENVILTLPDSRLLTNTGYYETARTGFVLEFVSTDTAADSTLKHRLKTVIYRLPDQSQVMFTLWGKGIRSAWDDVEPSVVFMQDGFAFLGESQDHVFVTSRKYLWPGLIIALAILATVLLIRKGRTGERPAESTPVHFSRHR
ncbi:hypothetical protein KQH82_08370 [bacterium]|nr:hypothetical protein [bacterium]